MVVGDAQSNSTKYMHITIKENGTRIDVRDMRGLLSKTLTARLTHFPEALPSARFCAASCWGMHQLCPSDHAYHDPRSAPCPATRQPTSYPKSISTVRGDAVSCKSAFKAEMPSTQLQAYADGPRLKPPDFVLLGDVGVAS